MNIHSLPILALDASLKGKTKLPADQEVLLRHVLPGEQVLIKGQDTLWQLDGIIAAHPARIVAPCPHYGHCGGCDLQHCHYQQQLHLKQQAVQAIFAASSEKAVQAAAALIGPALPSPQQFFYRQRIRLQKAGPRQCGFRRYRSHQVEAVQACLLASPELNTVLTALASVPAWHQLLTVTTEVELLFNPINRKVNCLLHLERKARPATGQQARQLLQAIPQLERIFFQGEKFPRSQPITRAGKAPADALLHVHYPAGDLLAQPLQLCWEAGGFFQVNLQQNLRLIALVCAWAEESTPPRVLDLFCGVGNFSLPLVTPTRQLLGIEGQAAAIRSACRNAAQAGSACCQFVQADVHARCRQLAAAGEMFDLVLVDPPRAGIPGLAATLATLCRHRLIYISCDPATLCRDLAALCQQGFSILKVQVVDMFPQTHHLETVVLLEK